MVIVATHPLLAVGRAEHIAGQVRLVTYAQAVAVVRLHPVAIHGGRRGGPWATR